MKADQFMGTGENQAVAVGEVARRWRLANATLLLVLLAIIGLYRETALSMVTIWARSDTFAHGFLVPQISLWLIWRTRRSFAGLVPRANYWVLMLLIGAGFAWLLGEMATVAPLSQFALTTMLVLAVPAILGFEITSKIVFPLGFLYFAVPFGEFAMPQLMEWTANVTILGLRFSGIPVYREGLHFVIPSGNWSVVEACSGVRYLIASLMVGTLFAYLNYRSFKRRLIFVVVSFVVPILANWLRAYMIVMLGHLSGNKLAAGVDHLIYGWFFFGIVIMAMFWIGARWREDEDISEPVADAQLSGMGSPRGHSLIPAAVAVVLLTAFWPFAEWQIERNRPGDISTVNALETIPGWNQSSETTTDWIPHFENASAYVRSTFTADGQKAGLYLAYYRNQGPERKLVTSINALVTSEDRSWISAAGGARQIAVNGRPLDIRTAELRGPNSNRLMVWQWYWINGRLTSSDHLAKAYTALYRLLGQGDDSAVIIVYADKDSAEGAEALLERFANKAMPAIEKALATTRSRR